MKKDKIELKVRYFDSEFGNKKYQDYDTEYPEDYESDEIDLLIDTITQIFNFKTPDKVKITIEKVKQ